MAVAAIKQFVNNYDQQVTVIDQEDLHRTGHVVMVNPGEEGPCDMWIPWCRSAQDFNNGHYIEIRLGNSHTWYIWQEDRSGQDAVRYSGGRTYSPFAQPLGGASYTGGDRTGEVLANGGFDLHRIGS